MVVKRSSRDIKRELRHLTQGQNCQESLGKIYQGMEIFGLTNGQYSIINIIEEVLQQTGPADINISTWTAANAEIKKAENFLRNNKIKSLRFLFDRGFPTRQPKYFELMRSLFGDEVFRLTRSHCKFVTIVNDQWNVAIRTSMNLNENKRIENFEISDCKALSDYLVEIVDGFFKEPIDYKGAKISCLNGIKKQEKPRETFNADEVGFDDSIFENM